MAALGRYFSLDFETLIVKDFLIYFSALGLIYVFFWDYTKLRAFTSFLFEGLEFQEEKPGKGVASRPAIW